MRIPPGARSWSARRLISLYPRTADSIASLFFANDGGSSTMVSKRRPSSTASRRKSKALAVTTSTLRKPFRSTFRRSASQACSEISTAVTRLARVASWSANPPRYEKQSRAPRLEPLEGAHVHVRAVHHPAWLEVRDQQIGQEFAPGLGGLDEELDGEHVAI